MTFQDPPKPGGLLRCKNFQQRVALQEQQALCRVDGRGELMLPLDRLRAPSLERLTGIRRSFESKA